MGVYSAGAHARWRLVRVASAANMLRRRHLALGIPAFLLLASGAAAAVVGTFTAVGTPAAVKPGTSRTYTITLTNSPTSGQRADRAKIGIPPGFVVDAVSVKATTTAAGVCEPAVWVADGELISSDKINLTSPSGGGNADLLCPGGTLTVTFTATSPTSEGTYTWVPELLRGDVPDIFNLIGDPPSVLVDGTAPAVIIGQKPSNPSNSRAATFSFAVDEPLGAFCRLDNAAFAPCSSPVSYTGIPDGPHTFTVAATDAAGNTGQVSYAWTVETGAPAVAVSTGPAALTNNRSATFAFSADEPSSFQCQLDGGASQPCSSPASYHGLGDGAHTFTVRPTDAVGNVGNSASYNWTIDATAPETTFAARPGSRTTAVSATFRFAANERVTFECKLDGAAFARCTSPKSYARLRKTRHTFEVRAIDAAGNIDTTPAVHRWTIAAAPRTVKKASALFAPQAGLRVKAPPLLRWRRVTGAAYYNVQLYRGRVKVLSAWPTRPRLQLRARWTYLGRQQKLSAGSYRWYVWPARSRDRYSRLLGQSTFIVTAR
jgi:hypothetical protein